MPDQQPGTVPPPPAPSDPQHAATLNRRSDHPDPQHAATLKFAAQAKAPNADGNQRVLWMLAYQTLTGRTPAQVRALADDAFWPLVQRIDAIDATDRLEFIKRAAAAKHIDYGVDVHHAASAEACAAAIAALDQEKCRRVSRRGAAKHARRQAPLQANARPRPVAAPAYRHAGYGWLEDVVEPTNPDTHVRV